MFLTIVYRKIFELFETKNLLERDFFNYSSLEILE